MAEVEATQIKAFGPGLTGGTTGKKCPIYLSGASINDLEEGLSFAVSGAGVKPDVIADFQKLNDEGNVEAFFVPLKPGEYKITIRFKGRQVDGSPFTAKVGGEPVNAEAMLSKVRLN